MWNDIKAPIHADTHCIEYHVIVQNHFHEPARQAFAVASCCHSRPPYLNVTLGMTDAFAYSLAQADHSTFVQDRSVRLGRRRGEHIGDAERSYGVAT